MTGPAAHEARRARERRFEIDLMLTLAASETFADRVEARKMANDLAASRAQLEQMREAARAIQANAEAWHGPPEDEPRRAAALAVIARWAQDPDSIPEGVREHARAALAAIPDPKEAR